LFFGDHHFFPSRLSQSAPTTTRLGTHLPHVPLHLSAPCLCMLRVVYLPKTLLFTLHTLFFCSLQALELVVLGLWKGLPRCVCFCRSLLILTTHPNYNFANTSFIFVCVQLSGHNCSPLNFWVQAAKHQKKVIKQVFLPCCYVPTLALIHPHCLTSFPLIFSH
jgi:hypothetical protein